MTAIDLGVYSTLALIAFLPSLRTGAEGLLGRLRRLSLAAPTPPPADPKDWVQKWTTLLIQLVIELDASGAKDAANLARQLIWSLIGGGKAK